MNIIVIDDNQAIRITLKMVLAEEFGHVAAVGDPTLIPALLATGDIDAVLLDMNFDNRKLDGSDGLFWLSRIKELESPPAVVLITAFGDVELAVESMKRGADDFVTKPWNNNELIAKLHRAINRNREALATKTALNAASELRKHDLQRRHMTLDQIKSEHIKSVVEQCGGNLTQAAERLGVNRQTLYNQLKKL